MTKRARKQKVASKASASKRFIFSCDADLLKEMKSRAGSLNMSVAQWLIALVLRDIAWGGPVVVMQVKIPKGDDDILKRMAAKHGLTPDQYASVVAEIGARRLLQEVEKGPPQ